MGRRHEEGQPIGDDCFMDTIANLIGILIIMVLIVGARSYTSAKGAVAKELETKRLEAAAPIEESRRLASDIDDQRFQLDRYERELASRSLERMVTNDRVNIAKLAIEKRLNGLDEESKSQFESNVELTELQKELADLLSQHGDVEGEEVPPAILQHLPTPMAKTVFGNEIHVLLSNRQFSVVPWTDLIEGLKREARGAVSRNTQRSQITNEIGPIGGFVMKYSLKNQAGMMSDGSTSRLGRIVELEKFVLTPTEHVSKESLAQTLATGGRLRAELGLYRDKNVTVTAWVYPDSFQEFRALKEQLFSEGYLCAARPLPFGVPIGASPNGSSSTAQ